jgi:hypothetical protein
MMSQLLDDCLSAANTARLNTHLESCTDCRKRWQSMQHLSAIFRDADLAQPPPDFTARVMNQIAARYVVTERQIRPLVRLPSGAVAATLVLASMTVIAFAALADGGQWHLSPSGSPDALDLSMAASGALLQTVGIADQIVRTAASVGRLIPAPAFIAAFLWLTFGVLALGTTLVTLLYAYRPAPSRVVETAQPPQRRHDDIGKH